ncbi:MAG: amidohydrolase family protein [Longimonas sp.]|uniref:amidohydrolase family protein n=1 Tax=Longimonas sp. TaxID=2039626 RepID=UPI00334F41B4
MSLSLSLRTASVAALLLCLVALPAVAQSERPAVTQTLAFENATVITEPGSEQTGVTVVVRNGIIRTVEAGASIPFDARVIDADSLYIYAGFIDGFSHTGIDMPEEEDAGSVDDPGNPSAARAGVQPERNASAFFDPGASRVNQLRMQGVTTAHVAPEGRMLPGQGALVNLHGSNAEAALLTDGVSLFGQFRGARGSWPNVVSPSTTMGVISMMRQVLRETERRQQLEAAYAGDPQGRQRPPRDAAHTALMPLLDGERPLIFAASSATDAHRILALQREMSFPLMIAGLKEGFNLLDVLQDADVPLFLSLDLPERTELDENEEPTAYDPMLRVHDASDTERERANLEQRLRAEQERYINQAATLHDAGLSFGFSTEGVSPGDLHGHLRTLAESGVPHDVLLAALTTTPAQTFGVDRQLGRVAPGFIANLVVTDGPLFDEDTGIRHVVVDGHLYTKDEAEAGEVTGDAEAVTGTWTMTLETPQGDIDIEVQLRGDDTGLTGSVVGPDGSEERLQSISFDGETLSFVVPGSQMGDARVSGTIEEDRFDGTISASGMSFDVTGQRTSPDRR